MSGPARVRPEHPLAAPKWEMASLVCLATFYLIGSEAFGGGDYTLLNFAGPVWLTATLCLGALRMAHIDANSIWTSLFWFRIASAIYFGLGALVPAQANLTTKLYMDAFFRPEPEQVFTFNLIVAFSVLTVLSAAALTGQPPARRIAVTDANSTDRPLLLAGISFAVVGFAIRLFLIVPYALGAFGQETLPGIVQTLGLLAPVSIYLLTRYAVNREPLLIPLLALGLLADMSVGVLMNNKSEVITSAIMFFLAYLARSISVSKIAVSVASITVIMTIIAPLTDFGRLESGRRHGDSGGGSLNERWEIANLYFSEINALPAGEEVQSLLVRISYVNAATFAIDQYDTGRPSHSLDDAWTVLIPRLLWPEKPVITNVGIEFNVLASNNEHSSSSPTLFAEAYWLLGWAGIPILMAPLGILLGVISRYTMWVLEESRWLYFPPVLLGMRMGQRVDGFYVTDILGPAVIFVAAHFAIQFLELVLWTLTKSDRLGFLGAPSPEPGAPRRR